MNFLKIALIGIIFAAGPAHGALSRSGPDYPKSGKGDKEADSKTLDPAAAEKFRKAKIAEITKKITNITRLIDGVNDKLDLRGAGEDEFDQKRSLENQLRDLITLFAMIDRAIWEAGRLTREVGAIRRKARQGLRDSRRLQLANFLDARRREYILFANR